MPPPFFRRDMPADTDTPQNPNAGSSGHGLGIVVPCTLLALAMIMVPMFVILQRRRERRRQLHYRAIESGDDWYPAAPSAVELGRVDADIKDAVPGSAPDAGRPPSYREVVAGH